MNKKYNSKIKEICNMVKSDIYEEAIHLLNSGMIDAEDYNKDEYALAKIIVSASIERCKYNFMPLFDKHKQEVKNLIRC